MYSSIVITNAINFANQKSNYKFTIMFDKINWKTIVNLQIYNKEFFKYYDGTFFMKVLSRVSGLIALPYDPNGKVYDGPEIKIRAYDTYSTVFWSNITNTKKEFDQSFYIPDLYISPSQQQLYDDVVFYLIKLSDNIFRDEIERKK